MDRQIITVDIAPGSNAQQRLMVSQGDIGRPLGVRIIQSGLPLNCTGYTAHLYVLKPDHNYYECTCTISNNNLISWDTAEQETPVAGECLAEIRITSGTNDIGTACFVEYVEASPADLGYASESFVSSMTEYVGTAQQAAQQAEQIVTDTDNVSDVAVDNSGHIVLTKRFGGTVTSDETVVTKFVYGHDVVTVAGQNVTLYKTLPTGWTKIRGIYAFPQDNPYSTSQSPSYSSVCGRDGESTAAAIVVVVPATLSGEFEYGYIMFGE